VEFEGFEDLARDHQVAALPDSTDSLLGWGCLHGKYDIRTSALLSVFGHSPRSSNVGDLYFGGQLRSRRYNNWMRSDLPLICHERSRLVREYADAASHHATSVREMAEIVRSGDEVRARKARRISRIFFGGGREIPLARYRHEADHSCDRTADLQNISETPPEPPAEPLPPHRR
jgi:hypothetical protein